MHRQDKSIFWFHVNSCPIFVNDTMKARHEIISCSHQQIIFNDYVVNAIYPSFKFVIESDMPCDIEALCCSFIVKHFNLLSHRVFANFKKKT